MKLNCKTCGKEIKETDNITYVQELDGANFEEIPEEHGTGYKDWIVQPRKIIDHDVFHRECLNK